MAIIILSLFDGISTGKIALNYAGVSCDKYYASEIDKYAIAVSKYNNNDIEFIGDVRYINGNAFRGIDLLIGGSPCQNFSFSGKKNGMMTIEKVEIVLLDDYMRLKESGFEFSGQSYLFWEFVRILKEAKPRYFLLENVPMPRKWLEVINKTLGVSPIEVNSNLFSAQNRRRLYWTNINYTLHRRKISNATIKNIMEKEVDVKYFGNKDFIITDENECPSGFWIGKQWMQARRIYNINCKSPAVNTSDRINIYLKDINKYRRLTPIEHERLQTLPDNYTKFGLFENNKIKQISDTQRYKMIGNGWTAKVIADILSAIK